MVKQLFFIAGTWLGLAGVSLAEEQTGVLQVHYASPKPRLMLHGEDQKTTVSVCDGDLIPRLTKLAGMEIKVDGSWSEQIKGSGVKCFAAKSFQVMKASSGREALVGKLVANPQGYFVEKDDGKLVQLPVEKEVPEEYKKLVGMKVIVDLKTFKTGPRLVSLTEHP